jgi:arsenate reductase
MLREERIAVKNVLFLCSHNSTRSIMAESLLRVLGAGKFNAFSAGSSPAPQVSEETVALLTRMNLPTDGLRPKSWDEYAGADAPSMDFVFTVCDQVAGETCPVWPGQPMTAHWGVPDPSLIQSSEAERGVAFHDTLRMLRNRIDIFCNLPIETLDEVALQHELDEIGENMDRGAE